MIPGEAARGVPAEKGAGDLLVTVGVVIKHPGRQAGRRIGQRVADRLRRLALLGDVALPELSPERGQCRLFLLGEPRRDRRPGEDSRRQVGRWPAQEVEMNARQPVRRLDGQRVGDRGADVAALGDVAGVTEAVHQLRPGARDVARIPADRCGRRRKAVAGQRRDDHIERVLGPPAVRGRLGQRPGDLEHLDDRTGPAVRDDHRQCVRTRRLDVNEVNVEAVDFGLELRQGIQPCLARAPVVLGRPVTRQFPQHRQLDALRTIGDELLGRPAGGRDAPLEVG